jgi:hypothetical protein
MPRPAVRRPVFARFYPRLTAGMERRGVSEHRRKLLATTPHARGVAVRA